MAKVETGVMVMKDGKAWGVVYKDGQSTSYGWIDPENAGIHDPRFCTLPTDVTYKNSPDFEELKKGKLVPVRRTTTVEVVNE
jgi:hypothetical protein